MVRSKIFNIKQIVIFILVPIFILGTFIDSIYASEIQAEFQETNLFSNLNGKTRIDSINQYATDLKRKSPSYRIKLGFESLKLSQNEEYKLGEVQAYFNIGAGYFHIIEKDSALIYYKKSFTIANQINNDLWIMNLATNLGEIYSDSFMFDSTDVYYFIGLEKAEQLHDSTTIGHLFNSIGNTYWKRGEFNLAIKNYKKALKINKFTNNKKRIVRSLNNLGSSYWNLSNYKIALEYYIEALNREKEYVKISSPIILNNIGLLYLNLNDFDRAEEYIEQASENAKIKGSILGLGYSNLNLGDLYYKKAQLDKALVYFQKAIDYYKKLKDNNGILQINNKIGLIYLRKREYTVAEHYFNNSYFKASKDKIQNVKLQSLINLSKLSIATKNNKKATKNLIEAFEIAKNFKFSEKKLEILDLQAEVYANLNNYKKAFSIQNKYDFLKDSLHNEKSERILMESKEKFESEKMDDQNRSLKLVNNIQKLEIENEKNRNTSLAIITLISLVFAIFLISENRKRRVKNKKLIATKAKLEETNAKLNEINKKLNEANISKSKFFSIIAHDLKNPFNTLLGATDILNSDLDTMSNEEREELVEIIYEDSRKLYELLENLLNWSRSQTSSNEPNQTTIFLAEIVKNSISLLKSNASNKNIITEINIQKHIAVSFDKIMLDTIIRNFYNNAIKFSHNGGKIEFNCIVEKGNVNLFIKDFGVGIKEENLDKLFDDKFDVREDGTNNEHGTGLGLLVCKEFAEKNGASISVESKIGKGSTFKIQMRKA